MYSVKELYDGVYSNIGVPIVFDYHHHRFCDGAGEQEALSWLFQLGGGYHTNRTIVKAVAWNKKMTLLNHSSFRLCLR